MNGDLTWHQSRAAESRRAILQAADKLFLRDGYKVSIDAISAEAGVARRTLYLQFGSKEALFRAVVDDTSSRAIAPLLKVLDDEGAPVSEVLTRFADTLVGLVFAPHSVAFLRLCIAESRFPDLGARHYETGMNRIIPALARYLAAKIEQGSIARDDPSLMAEQFLASVLGYRQYRALLAVPNPPIEAQAYVARAVAMFLAVSAAR